MSKMQIAALVGNYVLGTSVGFTISSVIKANVQPETVQEHLKITVGSIAIGLVAAEQAKNSIERQIVAAKTIWEQVQEEKEKANLRAVPSN